MARNDEEPASDGPRSDVLTRPDPPLRPRDEALRNVKDQPKEVVGDLVGGDGVGDVGGRALSTLLRIHWFTSFFCWLADRQFPSSHRPETRVSRLREKNPTFYWVCVSLDVTVGLVTVSVLLAAAAAALYKTIVL